MCVVRLRAFSLGRCFVVVQWRGQAVMAFEFGSGPASQPPSSRDALTRKDAACPCVSTLAPMYVCTSHTCVCVCVCVWSAAAAASCMLAVSCANSKSGL